MTEKISPAKATAQICTLYFKNVMAYACEVDGKTLNHVRPEICDAFLAFCDHPGVQATININRDNCEIVPPVDQLISFYIQFLEAPLSVTEDGYTTPARVKDAVNQLLAVARGERPTEKHNAYLQTPAAKETFRKLEPLITCILNNSVLFDQLVATLNFLHTMACKCRQ